MVDNKLLDGEKKVFFDGGLGRVCGVLHECVGAKEIVVVIHGFSSNKDVGAMYSAIMLDKLGISSLRIDLDNNGESELDFETEASVPNYIKQVEAAIEYCKSLGYKRISLIGTSYGGMVAFAVALGHPEIKRVALRAPVVDYERHAKWLYGEDKLEEFKDIGLVPYNAGRRKSFNVNFDFIEKSYPYSMFEKMGNVKIPFFIVHGDIDEEVDFRDSEEVAKAFENVDLHIIHGAGHDLGVDGNYEEGWRVLTKFFER